MSEQRLDLRDVPPPERHPKVMAAFDELDPGESLTLVNDHEPRPLYYQLREEVEEFDAEGYSVEAVGEDEFVAELPKQ